MATKSKTTGALKRTKVKNLPTAEKKMTRKAMKKVRGGLDLTSSVESRDVKKGYVVRSKSWRRQAAGLLIKPCLGTGHLHFQLATFERTKVKDLLKRKKECRVLGKIKIGAVDRVIIGSRPTGSHLLSNCLGKN
jgi:hypothetical protein